MPQCPSQYPGNGGYLPYAQQQPQAPWDREEGPWDYPMKSEADFQDWLGTPDCDRDPTPAPEESPPPHRRNTGTPRRSHTTTEPPAGRSRSVNQRSKIINLT